MKPRISAPTAIEWGAIAFGAWHASSLVAAWQHSPKDRFGGWLFIAWVLPVVVATWRERGLSHSLSRWRTTMVGLGILGILIGSMGKLNALIYLGFAASCSSGAFARPHGIGTIWLASSIGWMPAFSYLTNVLPGPAALLIKCIIVLPPTALMIQAKKHVSP